MALAGVQVIAVTGLAPAYATPLTTETVTPQANLFLHVKNASGSPINVTITDASFTPAGSVATNPVIAVPATTGDRMILIPPNAVNPATGLVTLTFSAVTSVTGALVRL
jgi:hypothetical protein